MMFGLDKQIGLLAEPGLLSNFAQAFDDRVLYSILFAVFLSL